jgi:hypothetical protein
MWGKKYEVFMQWPRDSGSKYLVRAVREIYR